jgi:putative ABC transport system ATP-binding protein
VAIARALANDPPLLVADEPTGNLDSQTAESVIALFEALVEERKTIIMVSHDQDLARRASRNVIIADGQISRASQGMWNAPGPNPTPSVYHQAGLGTMESVS